MFHLAWLTDIHLNFAPVEAIQRMVDDILACESAAIVISGDIGEADSFAEYLQGLHECTHLPIYFVLGNHDFYHSSIAAVREAASRLTTESPGLWYLPAAGVVRLTDSTALVGHDGWGDGRGEFLSSTILLNDYRLIDELAQAPFESNGETHRDMRPGCVLSRDLQRKLHTLGDEAADSLQRLIRAALATYRDVIVATHVPPFRESCVYDGHGTDDNWAPHFTCQAVGEMLLRLAPEFPGQNITVLCGHTHGGVCYQALENLRVITGAAEYRAPVLQDVLVLK